MLLKRKLYGKIQKGDEGMQDVLKTNNVKSKMQLLKARAKNILQDETLRHLPNEHDIKKCSENTKLLHTHQQDTIRKED